MRCIIHVLFYVCIQTHNAKTSLKVGSVQYTNKMNYIFFLNFHDNTIMAIYTKHMVYFTEFTLSIARFIYNVFPYILFSKLVSFLYFVFLYVSFFHFAKFKQSCVHPIFIFIFVLTFLQNSMVN